jgi:hypothetical protein
MIVVYILKNVVVLLRSSFLKDKQSRNKEILHLAFFLYMKTHNCFSGAKKEIVKSRIRKFTVKKGLFFPFAATTNYWREGIIF